MVLAFSCESVDQEPTQLVTYFAVDFTRIKCHCQNHQKLFVIIVVPLAGRVVKVVYWCKNQISSSSKSDLQRRRAPEKWRRFFRTILDFGESRPLSEIG